MLTGQLPPADEHYRKMLLLSAAAIRAGHNAWVDVDPRFIRASWRRLIVQVLLPFLRVFQIRAALAGSSYAAGTLAAQGLYVPPLGFVDPMAWGEGLASDGRPLASLLESPSITALLRIGEGMPVADALDVGRSHLDTIIQTQIQDAGRQAAETDTASRKGVGYVRMLNPPSCSRCVILAGKFFRWNEGFRRHPRCKCVHVETTAVEALQTEGLVTDPYEYFHSLTEAEQDGLFGEGNAQAIRDGADIYQVENRRLRGSTSTTAGAAGRRRRTPEDIYKAASSREDAIRELERAGYILPGGQVPGGVIRGDREGFGALGRGGARVGAREAVLRARETGVRDPATRATMTAAERRFFDAQRNWDAVLEGRNPFRPHAKLTPEVAARVEREFRRFIATDGEIFTD
jgi:hypothetical protein